MVLTILGTTGSDVLAFTPTGANSGTVTAGSANLQIVFTSITGAFTIDPLGGGDVVTLLGNSGNNTILATGGPLQTVQVDGTKAAHAGGRKYRFARDRGAQRR